MNSVLKFELAEQVIKAKLNEYRTTNLKVKCMYMYNDNKKKKKASERGKQ